MLLGMLNKDEEVGLGLTNEQIEAAKSEKRNPFSASLGWAKQKGQGLLAPYKSANFGANNPELGLLKDQETKAKLQRSSMMAGLGSAGQALLANSGKSVAEAFGAGAEAFGTGSNQHMNQGLLVAKEIDKEKGLDAIGADPNMTHAQKKAFDYARLVGDPSLYKSYLEKPQNIGTVDPTQFTTESLEDFDTSQEDGSPDYSLLKVKPELLKDAMTTGDGVRLTQNFETQAANMLKFKFITDSEGNMTIDGFELGATDKNLTKYQASAFHRQLVADAFDLYMNGVYQDPRTNIIQQVTPANAMNFATNRFRLNKIDKKTGQPISLWNYGLISDLYSKQDKHDILDE